jgi:site-specific DNA-methyltransferase (adenine-specific)
MKNEQKRVHSATDEWSTPQWLFNKLDSVFHFEFDLAANEQNKKCARFTNDFFRAADAQIDFWVDTIATDGFAWCNPPYSKQAGGLEKWIECVALNFHNAVMLIPAAVGSQYWHRTAWQSAGYVCFLRGRLKFESANEKNIKASAMFDSALLIFTQYGFDLNQEQKRVLRELGALTKVVW